MIMMHVFLENQDKRIMNPDEILESKINNNIIYITM
jgi:hypothetical protein